MSQVHVGVDVGGTFTDLVAVDQDGVRVAKVPSTPADQSQGVVAGLRRLGAEPSAIGRFAHGTTVATNAVLERGGARAVLVTTRGFRDVLEIARQNRPRLYDLSFDRPPPVVPRELVVEADERVAADGSVLGELADPEGVAAAVRALDPESVAVCLLFSFLHPDHERAIGRALDGLPVSLSSEVLPVFREYERANTTALNAYVAPMLGRYLGTLAGRLRAAGLVGEVQVMRSGGGTLPVDLAERLAVHTLLSGPAAGAWGAAGIARAAGFPDAIAFDMGGTSTDATLIEGGRPRMTAEGSIGGLPFAVASTEVHTVGAGGGSVAWMDPGGSLRVGPRSAGADPGPACYGRGGDEPTVTDAYVVLGLLDPSVPLGGTLALQSEPATRVMSSLGASVGLQPAASAEGVLRVAEARVEAALRVVSVERGKDPRGYALLAFGGAGPLHQGRLSRDLGCTLSIVPPNPGVLAAFGLLMAPASVDVVRTHVRDLGAATAGELQAAWGALEDEARSLLADRDGSERVARSADCRYRGQAFELAVPVADGAPGAIAAAFHQAHLERYGYDHPQEAVEIVNLRVRAEGPEPDPPLPRVSPGRGAPAALVGTRRVVLEGKDRDCPVYRRDGLGEGDQIDGAAVVTGLDSTCLILDGQRAQVDALGNLLVRER